jgi:two-component system, chemotaxis family, sensor kinase CheA
MIDMDMFRGTYITECFELIEDMEAQLLQLDEGSASSETLNAIFRCAHSIKGGAGAFEFHKITKVTHALETFLDMMRDGRASTNRHVIDVLLSSIDIVRNLVQAASESREMEDGFGEDLIKQLEVLCNEAGNPVALSPSTNNSPQKPTEVSNSGANYFSITFIPQKELFLSGNDPLLIIRELKTLGKLEVSIKDNLPEFDDFKPEQCYLQWSFDLETNSDKTRINECFEFVEDLCTLKIESVGGLLEPFTPTISESETEAVNDAPTLQTSKPKEEAPQQQEATRVISSIRVDIDKVDKLVNMVGELVITQSMLNAQAKFLPIDQNQDLLSGINELSQHCRELQEAVMSVRMQPVKSIFSRIPRIVRDIATQLKKDIKLETYGENTEVDKTVIEQLGDPLTHMIRNSADHGVETPEVRIAKGKPAQGTIKLSAEHRGGRIVITIEDDGAGINRERVLNKAKEKGLVPIDANLAPEEIDRIIFLPGFSTAETVSNISGRGVGMDVVRKNIEAIGGIVSIVSNPDKGSIFTVLLPLTLAILDGMIVRVSDENYIIPITNILETLCMKQEDMQKVDSGNNVISIRGEFVPVIRLHEIFCIKESKQKNLLVVLVENGKEKYGIIVDELIGQQQVVIKSLDDNADPVDGISGATILGDGKVSLILDVGKLMHIYNMRDHSKILKKAS